MTVISTALFDLLGYPKFGLNGVKQSLCKPVNLQRIYIFLFSWTQYNSKETITIFSIKSLSRITLSKIFLPCFLYCSLTAFSLLFHSPPFLFWEILISTKKWPKKIYFHEFQHMPLFWEVTPSWVWGERLLLFQSTSCIEGLLTTSIKSGKRFIFSLSESESGP